jgi:hypothetical protein
VEPTGSEAPPASAITPFMPTTTPGVAKPWTASSAQVVENAVPSRIARPSRAFTPAIVRPAATTAAVPAAITTGKKWASGLRSTGVRPTNTMASSGTAAAAAARRWPSPSRLRQLSIPHGYRRIAPWL